jgi:CRISPR-associated protein Cas5t
MKAYRVSLTSWTASFRYPNLISGYQPSLVVPPLSTIYGLISAAAGDYVSARDAAVGYVFRFRAQTIELETIYQFNAKSSPLTTKSNVIRRQVLFDNSLWLYVTEPRIAEAFRNPHFQLLLGRSSDLASVDGVDEVELSEREELTALKGTAVPMGTVPLGVPIQALPISFTNEIPRKNLGTRPFFLLEYEYRQTEALPVKGYLDPELSHEVYWHDFRGAQW